MWLPIHLMVAIVLGAAVAAAANNTPKDFRQNSLLLQHPIPPPDEMNCDNYQLVAGDAPARYSALDRRFLVQDSDGSFAHWLVAITPSTSTTRTIGPGRSLPVAGDWVGSGFDGVGIYDVDTATFQLKVALTDGPADYTVQFGHPDPTAKPIAGTSTWRACRSSRERRLRVASGVFVRVG